MRDGLSFNGIRYDEAICRDLQLCLVPTKALLPSGMDTIAINIGRKTTEKEYVLIVGGVEGISLQKVFVGILLPVFLFTCNSYFSWLWIGSSLKRKIMNVVEHCECCDENL